MPAGEPIVIHHIEGRRSHRVAWLCEELGVPYTLDYEPGDRWGSLQRIRKAHPLMPVAPAVRFDGEIIVESGAILEVIQARYGDGRLVPPVESGDFPLHKEWVHFAEGSAGSRFFATRAAAQGAGITPAEVPEGWRKDTDIAAPVLVGSQGIIDYIEDYLGRHPYFGGAEFSLADIMMHWIIRMGRLVVWLHSEDYPHISAWRGVVEARPAFLRASEKCTPTGTDVYGLPLLPGIDPAIQMMSEPPAR